MCVLINKTVLVYKCWKIDCYDICPLRFVETFAQIHDHAQPNMCSPRYSAISLSDFLAIRYSTSEGQLVHSCHKFFKNSRHAKVF